MTQQYYYGSEFSSTLPLAASELLALAKLEFLADPYSARGVALGQLALLVLRVESGILSPPASENFRFFPNLENSTGGHYGDFRRRAHRG